MKKVRVIGLNMGDKNHKAAALVEGMSAGTWKAVKVELLGA